MSALLELAERCERAKGPDRDLDADIASTQGWSELPGDNWCGPTGGICVPAYTASLDAAMALVPDGWERVQQEQARMSDGSVRCWASVGDWPASPKRCATPALALCAAALRARAAQSNGGSRNG